MKNKPKRGNYGNKDTPVGSHTGNDNGALRRWAQAFESSQQRNREHQDECLDARFRCLEKSYDEGDIL